MSSKKEIPLRTLLPKDKTPRYWYNVTADIPTPPAPCLVDGRRASEDDFAALYGSALARQELYEERFLEIPAPIRETYMQMRPSPLCRAYALEKSLNTPAHIYYKYEESRPYGAGSLPTLMAQAWFHKQRGCKLLVTELSAADWACAAAYAAAQLSMDCVVYATETTMSRFPTAVTMVRLMGGRVEAVGDPLTACRTAGEEAGYLTRGVRAFSLLHQTVIGIEARTALEQMDEYPDMVVGADNAGLDFAGIALPFMQEKLAGRIRTQFVLVNAASCPICTKGIYAYDYDRDVPFLSKGYTLGKEFPFGDGVSYARTSPILSELVYAGYVEPLAVSHRDTFDAAVRFMHTEGILPAFSSACAIAQLIREAENCREVGAERVLLASVSSVGDFDLGDYAAMLRGEFPEEDARLDVKLAKAFTDLPYPKEPK